MVNFEREGVVSIWLFRKREDPSDADKDVLREFCGVEYYDVDSQEGVARDEPQPVASLLGQLSYSGSFIDDALIASGRMGITEAFGVLAQFDFAYDPNRATGAVSADPVFVGVFAWHE